MKTKPNGKKAFTIIEIVVVIGIIAVIAAVSAFYLGSRKNTVTLTSTANQVSALLSEAQSRSMAQASDTTWGVHFDNGSSSQTPFYALFSGSSYALGTVVNRVSLPPNVCFATSSVAQSSTLDIMFNPISGAVSTPTSITLNLVSSGCNSAVTTSSLITVNSLGSVAVRGALQCSGALNPSWSSSVMPNGVVNGQSDLVNNGYIYFIGGYSSVATTTVLYTSSTGSGALNSWLTTTALPTSNPVGLWGQSNVANNGYIYIIGGDQSVSLAYVTSTVLYTSSTASGALNSWLTTSALPSPNYEGAAVVLNGYVYVIGGKSSTATNTATTTVRYTSSTASGALNSWLTTSALPVPLTGQSYVVSGGYIYIIGGVNTAGIASANVYYTSSTASGALNPWRTSSNTLPTGQYYSSGVVNAGYIYAIGGYDPSATSTVIYAPINSDNSVGSWTSTTPLPTSQYGDVFIINEGLVNNGYIYAIGGSTNEATSYAFYTGVSACN